ncbi:hypothetical protein DPMN_178499 [Dreissena polymorpha]|uniref:Uncharacterized protein n=1 Tax=Dreissena polymorpha TaxID=45954 RepID=A0A9D4EFC3_DREPO|nr:hypothetical protein DPMN_178499 [Dreissena polymorpha]
MCQSWPSKQLQAPAVTVAESSDSESDPMDAEIDERQGYLDEESCSDEEDCDLIVLRQRKLVRSYHLTSLRLQTRQ